MCTLKSLSFKRSHLERSTEHLVCHHTIPRVGAQSLTFALQTRTQLKLPISRVSLTEITWARVAFKTSKTDMSDRSSSPSSVDDVDLEGFGWDGKLMNNSPISRRFISSLVLRSPPPQRKGNSEETSSSSSNLSTTETHSQEEHCVSNNPSARRSALSH